MPVYYEVVVNIPAVSGVFHYHLSPELENRLQPGQLVAVPFGGQIVQGVALRPIERPEVSETRPVLSLVDEHAVLTASQLALAGWLSKTCLAPLSACIGLMLPAGLEKQSDRLYSLGPGQPKTPLQGTEASLAALLTERGELRGRQLERALAHKDWSGAARRLEQKKLITSKPVLLAPTVRPKQARTARLACSPDEALQNLDLLGKTGTAARTRRQAMLEYLIQEGHPVETTWLFAASQRKESDPSVPDFSPFGPKPGRSKKAPSKTDAAPDGPPGPQAGTNADLQRMVQLGFISLGETETWRDPLADLVFTPAQPPRLTADQQKAASQIAGALQTQTPKPILLHGVTGSGKTEIYMQAATETLRQGRQVIVLVPEIGMTPQIVHRFAARFAGQVGLLHSSLSEGERYDTWRRARQGELSIIIGARSALFAPLPNLGLIVVDECHDDSYYNADALPYYHARRTAAAYARLCGALCVFGSATPDIESRFLAEQGEYDYIRLPERILAHRAAVAQQLSSLNAGRAAALQPAQPSAGEDGDACYTDLPPVEVVDMRLELKAGSRSIFSRALQEALKATYAARQQAILFINRRGSATYVFCRACGYTLRCPRCDIPLTLHTDLSEHKSAVNNLLCHRCGYARQQPTACPKCRSPQIRQYGTGAEKVEEEVKQLLPQASVLRLDFDSTRQKNAHEIILRHFSNHQADVLVGTQMVAKGLDLPLVTLVGVILADVGLQLPDLRAAERSFQLLTQVAGRAGRSPLGGQAIFQTFLPEHYVIQAAARHDYTGFYQQELGFRRSLSYPPFARLLRLEYRSPDPDKAEAAAQEMAAQVTRWLVNENRHLTEIIGPAPCFFARQDGQYRWQILLRGPDPVSLLPGRNLPGWKIEVDPVSLL